MNSDRIKLVLDNYAAHFNDPASTPADAQAHAAAHCQALFDLNSPDLNAMLRDAFSLAVPVINYAGSVQPLNGLFLLAEQAPDVLRAALAELLTDDSGDLDARQVRMQRFAELCNAPLRELAPGKRAWEQNVRSAMAVLSMLRPEQNYLYKATEARSFADMIGFSMDVSAGSAFRVSNYYALCDALSEVMRRHEKLAALIPDETHLHMAVYDLMLMAPAAKRGLFGDLPALIKTRSRAGQANQERAQRISRMQMEIALMHSRAEGISRQIAELPELDLVGQHFVSAAFGEVEAIRQEPGRLTILVNGAEKKMALPMSILQGFLIPQEEETRARYEQERTLISQRQAIEADIRNRETEVYRLQSKP